MFPRSAEHPLAFPLGRDEYEHRHISVAHREKKNMHPPDLTYAYVLPAPPLPSSTAQSPVFQLRRPRAHARNEFFGTPCLCHRARSRAHRRRLTTVASGREDDDTQGKKDWFSGMRVWFRPKEQDGRGEADANKNGNGKTDMYDMSDVSGKEEQKEEGFRWPWQKDEEIKPGGFSKRDVKASEKRRKDDITWQERWRGLSDMVAPGFSKGKDDANDAKKQRMTRASDVRVTKVRATSNKKGVQAGDGKNNERKRGVTELYRPPSEPAGDNPSSSSNKESWFKFPWEGRDGKDVSGSDAKTDVKGDNRTGTEFREQKRPSSGKANVRGSPSENVQQSKVSVSVREKKEGAEKIDPSSKAPDLVESDEKKLEAAVALQSNATTPEKSDLVSIPPRDIATIRLIFGSETFFATETISAPGGLIFRGNLRGEPKATVAKLEERLAARLNDKYTLCLAEGEEDLRPVVVVVPTARDKRPATTRQKVMAVVIAFMTVSTCLGRGLLAVVRRPTIRALHGATQRSNLFYRLFDLPSTASLSIAVAIGIVIVSSQIVQRIVAARKGTRIAIPFLLPSYQLGSFGAVVQLASPTPTRAALFDIALAGAATLTVLSFACLLIGLRLSTSFSSVIPVPMSLVSNSVVMGFLTQQVPDGKILIDYGRSLIGLHPLAVIGANCMTIAALNLLPIRQLDGGRIISALYGRKTAVMASRVTVLFLLLASSKSPYLIVFLAAITFGPWSLDRPSKNELTEPNGVRTIVGYLFMLLMIGILLPFPACKFFGTL